MSDTAIAQGVLSKDTQAIKTYMNAAVGLCSANSAIHRRVHFLRQKNGVKKYADELQFVLGYN